MPSLCTSLKICLLGKSLQQNLDSSKFNKFVDYKLSGLRDDLCLEMEKKNCWKRNNQRFFPVPTMFSFVILLSWVLYTWDCVVKD